MTDKEALERVKKLCYAYDAYRPDNLPMTDMDRAALAHLESRLALLEKAGPLIQAAEDYQKTIKGHYATSMRITAVTQEEEAILRAALQFKMEAEK
jgi:hypothetical protein